MSKNMTRKGLAFGAGLALVVSGFAGAPAQAATVSGSMDLTAASGPSTAFATFSETGKTLSLTASSITSGSNVKLLVNDPSGVVEPKLVVGTTPYATKATTTADSANSTLSVTTRKATIRIANSFSAGDKVYFSADIEPGAATGAADALVAGTVVIADDTVFTVDVASSTEFTLVEDVENVIDTGEFVQIDDASAIKLVRSARSAGSYVVDTGITAAGLTNVQFALNSATGDDYSATVQAFSDADGDNAIAAGALNEYVSPARTLQWVDPTSLVTTTIIDAPTVGAQTLTATVTTDPMLNGVQLGEASAIKIAYTRQDSDKIGASANATQSAVTGEWTAAGLPLNSVDADNAGDVDFWTAAAGAIAAGDGVDWGFTRAIAGTGATTSVTSNVATTTKTAHLLRVGDKVTFTAANGDADAAIDGLQFTVATVPTANTFTFAVTRANIALITQAYTVTTLADGNKSLVDGVFPGTYSARALVLVDYDGNADEWQYSGLADARGTFAATGRDVSVATVGSATLQGTVYNTDAANKVLVKAATNLSVPVVATVLDVDGDAIGAGRSVLVRVNSVTADVKVNAKTTNSVFYTDANGQITFNVTSTAGADGAAADVDIQPEGDNTYTTRVIVEWDKQDYSMIELGMTGTAIVTPRVIAAGGSYDLQVGVLDEWFQAAAAADYRIKVTGSGVSEGFVTLVDGRATIKVTDNKLSATTFSAVVTLQKLGTTGVFADVAGSAVTMVHNIAPASANLLLAAGGQTLYKATATVTTSAVAKVALVELDKRLSLLPTPVYVNNAVVTGKALNGTTAAALAGSVVTISGPTNILFEEGNVAKRGGLTFLADGAGEFAVNLYSTSAQTDSVITVIANGVTKTVKVSFTGIGIGEGTALTVTTPAAVKPASTFQVKAKLADAYGNGVAAAAVKVTYTGAGIVFGALPTATDANGELQFAVLLGSNDSGTVSVTVSYDQNADLDYLDAKDLVVTSTTEITASGVVASAEKVNAGSFKGYVALYAKGYKGQRMSAKVGKDWVVVASLASDFERVVEFTGAGVDVAVRIYIDRVLMDTINLTTK